MNGWPWSAIKRLSEAATATVAERAMLLAAVAWVDRRGCLCPAVETWAALAGCDVRTAQRRLNALKSRGIVVLVIPSLGGSAKTATYCIPLLAENPGVVPELDDAEPRHGVPKTPASEPPNSGMTSRKPRRVAGGTSMNSQENNHQPAAVVVGDVFDRLGIPNLRGHPNATPERLAWIEREAPTKNNPAGWAARCIREAWMPPAPSPAEARGARAAERDALLSRFDAMTPSERTAVLARVRREFPNLSDRLDSDRAVRAAAVKVMGRSA